MPQKIKEDVQFLKDQGLKTYFCRQFLDRAVRYWWNNKPRFRARGNYAKYKDVGIDRPIFLLGTQGGGLTFVSRLLRRQQDVISLSGNCQYWAGMDEIQNEYFFDIPQAFRLGIKERHGAGIQDHELWGKERSWTFACDDLLEQYAKGESDFTDEGNQQFSSLIKKLIFTYSRGVTRAPRFIDKSQSFILKIPLLRKMYPDAKFIVVSRNPTVMCWRAAYNIYPDFQRKELDIQTRLDYACQHWRNSYEAALAEENVFFLKFENLLREPELYLNNLLNFCELDSDANELLPKSNDEYPLGSVGRDKWFPMKPDINKKYTDLISKDDSSYIWRKLHGPAKKLGYGQS